MNHRRSQRIGICILAPAWLFFLCGCQDQPPTPTKKSTTELITLRVVMLVETGADLNSPPPKTGGCKLTRTQVTQLLNELIQFAPTFCSGLKFIWPNQTIEKLESDCMRVLALFPCTSQCFDLPFQDRCPRRMNISWFADNIVDSGPGGPALLQQHDNYVEDERTINIYFVGNVVSDMGEIGLAITRIPSHPNQDFVVVNDVALLDPSAPANFPALQVGATLLHEVGCHWLRDDISHVPEGQCPRNLCISGTTFNQCFDTYNGRWPRDFTIADHNIVCDRLNGLP